MSENPVPLEIGARVLDFNGVTILNFNPIGGPFVRRDGTTPLTGNWDAGNFLIDSRNSNRWVNLATEGADKSGVADSTAAIIASLALHGKANYYFEPGTYRITPGAIVIDTHGTRILGDAGDNVFINAIGGFPGPVFDFNNGAQTINFCGVSRLRFVSADIITQKTMVRIVDGVHCIVEQIYSNDTPGFSWLGNGSIGVDLNGRQENRVRNCQLYADLPIVINTDPNVASISLDHSSVKECDLVVTAGLNNASISIATGTVLTAVEFSNLAFVRGKYGVFCNDTGPGLTVWQGLTIKDCRQEQTNDATGYAISLKSTVRQIQNLLIDNMIFDANMNGVELASVGWPVLRQVAYGGTGVAWNLAANVIGATLINCFRQSGSSVTDLSNSPSAIQCIVGANPPYTSIGKLTPSAGGFNSYRSFTLKSAGNLTLANGRNDNVIIGDTSFVQAISGPTAAFQISGIVPTDPSGQYLTMQYNGGFPFTILHNDVNSLAANRIFCAGAANKTPNATFGSATFIYDPAIPGWLLTAVQ